MPIEGAKLPVFTQYTKETAPTAKTANINDNVVATDEKGNVTNPKDFLNAAAKGDVVLFRNPAGVITEMNAKDPRILEGVEKKGDFSLKTNDKSGAITIAPEVLNTNARDNTVDTYKNIMNKDINSGKDSAGVKVDGENMRNYAGKDPQLLLMKTADAAIHKAEMALPDGKHFTPEERLQIGRDALSVDKTFSAQDQAALEIMFPKAVINPDVDPKTTISVAPKGTINTNQRDNDVDVYKNIMNKDINSGKDSAGVKVDGENMRNYAGKDPQLLLMKTADAAIHKAEMALPDGKHFTPEERLQIGRDALSVDKTFSAQDQAALEIMFPKAVINPDVDPKTTISAAPKGTINTNQRDNDVDVYKNIMNQSINSGKDSAGVKVDGENMRNYAGKDPQLLLMKTADAAIHKAEMALPDGKHFTPEERLQIGRDALSVDKTFSAQDQAALEIMFPKAVINPDVDPKTTISAAKLGTINTNQWDNNVDTYKNMMNNSINSGKDSAGVAVDGDNMKNYKGKDPLLSSYKKAETAISDAYKNRPDGMPALTSEQRLEIAKEALMADNNFSAADQAVLEIMFPKAVINPDNPDYKPVARF